MMRVCLQLLMVAIISLGATALAASGPLDSFRNLPARHLSFPRLPYGRFGEIRKVIAWNPISICDYFIYHCLGNGTPAVGTVDVKAGSPIKLVLNSEASSYLSALSKFAPDDFQQLSMITPAEDDIELRYFSTLTGLHSLEVSNTDVVPTDLSPLKSLVNLEELTITQCNPTDECLKTVCQLPNLKILSFGRSTLTGKDLSPLCRLSKLEGLDLTAVPLTSTQLQSIGKLSHLRKLVLSSTKVDDSGWEQLGKLTNLKILKVSHTSVSDRMIEKISNLPIQCLELDVTKVTDRCVPYLSRMKTLKMLNLNLTKISKTGLIEIAHKLPRTQISARRVDAQKLYHEFYKD